MSPTVPPASYDRSPIATPARGSALRVFFQRRRPSRDARPPLWRDLTLWAFGLVTLLVLLRIGVEAEPPAPVAPDLCRVTYVFDGDTVEVACGGGRARVRLAEVDTPELFSPACEAERLAAERAKIALESWVKSAQFVRVVRHGHDRYGRDIASLYIGDVNLGERLIAAGYGRAYRGGRRGGWC